MDNSTLVNKQIHDGARIIRALDAAGFNVVAGMWLYIPESMEWRLIIASPFVDLEGPKRSYDLLQRELKALQYDYSSYLGNISLVSPRDNLIQLIRTAIVTGSGISKIRFRRNAINNFLIEDALIYRMT